MRKFSAIALLLSLLITSSSCISLGDQENQPSTITENKFTRVSHAGLLKALEVKLEPRATHFLELENNEIVLIFSNLYNLDSNDYLNNKIRIRGLLHPGQKGEKDVVEIEFLEVIEKLTAGLKLYSNLDLELKIEYSDLLTIQKIGDKITLKATDSTIKQEFLIERFELPAEQTTKEWLQKTFQISPEEIIDSKFGSNISALKVLSSNENTLDFYINQGNFVYHFSHSSQDEDKETFRQLFYDLHKTVEFLGTTEKEEKSPNEEPADKTAEDETKLDEPTEDPEKPTEETSEEPEEPTEDLEPTEEPPTEPVEKPEPVKNPTPEPIEDPEPTEDPEPSTKTDHQTTITHLQNNLTSLTPEEAPTDTTWSITQFEFAEPNYVYISYQAGTAEQHKLLLTYSIDDNSVTTTEIGYFKAGEEKDWIRVSGSNPAVLKAREVYIVSDGSAEKATSLLEGYRLFESNPYKFKMQYPAYWYYSGGGGHYSFSSQPITGDNELIGITVLSGDLASQGIEGTSSTIDDKTIIKKTEDDLIYYYLEKSDGKTYRFRGESDQATTIETMISTLKD